MLVRFSSRNQHSLWEKETLKIQGATALMKSSTDPFKGHTREGKPASLAAAFEDILRFVLAALCFFLHCGVS